MSVAGASRARAAKAVAIVRAVSAVAGAAVDRWVMWLHAADAERVDWPDGFPRCRTCRPLQLWPCDTRIEAWSRVQERRALVLALARHSHGLDGAPPKR